MLIVCLLCSGSTGVVSSESPKPSSKSRLRWTPELHEKFITAVARLGGAEREYRFRTNVVSFLLLFMNRISDSLFCFLKVQLQKQC